MSKIVVITGGSGGIGSEVARRVAAQHSTPVLVARDSERLAACAAEIGAPAYAADVLDDAAFAAVIKKIEAEVGAIDAVVHAVGSVFLKPLHSTSVDDWRRTLEINATSAFIVMRNLMPLFMRRKRGSAVFFSTVAASMGLANHESIAAAKSAVEGLVKSAAISYARYGIRVNAVAPALTRTELSRNIWGTESILAASIAMHPLNRIGEPADIAAAVMYFLSDEAGWTTGQILGVDGGLATGMAPPRAMPVAAAPKA
jgi:NAD(P)-dependent dehydrogenase (short-subunit alcohol dehydrogenase family)